MCFVGLTRSCTIGFSQETLRLPEVSLERRTKSEQNRSYLCGEDHDGYRDSDDEGDDVDDDDWNTLL